MKKRPLGDSGIDVTPLCLGTMTFGEQNTEAEAHQQLDRALDAGINFIDTAEMYPVPPKGETQGRTETYIGSWLKKRGRRDDIVLASKAAGAGRHMTHLRGGPKLDRNNIHQAIDDSLARLNTDYLDLYQLHWPDRQANYFGKLGYTPQDDTEATPIEDTLEALKELVNAGKVRTIGLSNETPWGVMTFLHLADKLGLPRVVSVQNPYNLLNRSYEVGLAEISHRERVGLLAYSPLAFGVLSGKYLGGMKPENARLTLFERFQRYTSTLADEATWAYVDIARRFGLDPAQMALAYVTSRPFVTSNIIGATTMAQLESNLQSAELELSDEVIEAIEGVHQRLPNPSP
ncbi:NADP(H)-dependent aldo-keto reductase [Larsenimonas salina]|uniref:NADP(H)-dependent aldo-keto reductase n=1 Tax=Larsenimonas salina TaxID=1295565 RepID=UPI002073490A|nr:NADP(H)-dependent aldo-keto reductase [Larsenimonas salina]MCM5705547.1 NADP(H)-dependent aldo-keto reductase [Larsenimonas salina]